MTGMIGTSGITAGGPGADGPSELVTAARALLGAAVRPAEGGFSGETFLIGLPGEEAVLRLYVRSPGRAAVDAALLRLVRGLVPVPRVLDLRPPSEAGAGEPAHLLLERVPGVRLELLLAGGPRPAPARVRQRAGRELGVILARLAGIPFLRGGTFADAELRVVPWSGAAAELPAWVAEHAGAPAFDSWPSARWTGLLAVAERAQQLLEGPTDAVAARTCLVHGDLNPKNVLVDPDTGRVTALVDWEFAHAGVADTDLGNLLRFETDETFCRAVVRAYLEHLPGPDLTGPSEPGGSSEPGGQPEPGWQPEPAGRPGPAERIARGRALDLFALVELAVRADGPAVHPIVSRARDLLVRTAADRDLAAGRPSWVP